MLLYLNTSWLDELNIGSSNIAALFSNYQLLYHYLVKFKLTKRNHKISTLNQIVCLKKILERESSFIK